MYEKKSIKLNAFLSVFKQLFSILFPMITFPYATRILGAANYGKYTFSLSVVNYISYIAAAGILRYAIRECARVREDKVKLQKLVNEIFTINVISTCIAFSVLFGLLFFVPMLKVYTPYILVLSLSVLFTTLGTDWINSAFEDYFYITIRYILCQLVAICLLFVLVKSTDNLLEYSIVSVTAAVLANALNIIHIRKTLGIVPTLCMSKELAVHIKPIVYLFVCTIATFIYINSDVTILGIFKDDTAVGYYGVSTQFYQLVKQLINAAFVVVIPRISNELASDKLKAQERYNDILILTILLVIPSSIGMYMVREKLILVFAGVEYIRASSSLGILALAIVPAMLANFFINIVMIPLKREREVTIATILSALINVALNFVLVPRFAENAAAFTTLLAELTMLIVALFFCRTIRFINIVRTILVGLIGGLLIMIVCTIVNFFVSNIILNLFLSISISVVVYGLTLVFFCRKFIIKMLALKGQKN